MSIASEITRLQTSKADIKAQVNIDVDDINEGTDFIDEETLDDYADLIEDMQDAYKQYIPIYTKMIAKGNTSQSGTPTPTSPVEVKTVKGEQTITISNGTDSKDYEIDLKSKNLLDYTQLATRTESGITIKNNGDGTFSVNGTATADISLVINNETFVPMSGTWRMLGCPSGGSSSTYMLSAYVGYWGGGSPNIDTGNGTSITYTGNVKVRFYIKSGTTCNNLLFKPMLTYDTEASYNNFSSYYNIELCKIGNYQDLIRKGTGKNLFNNSDIKVGYSINASGEETENSVWNAGGFFKVKPNTTYTISIKYATTGNAIYTQYNSSKTFISRVGITGGTTTFTTSATTEYLRYSYRNDQGISNIQIEENSSATYYEPYGYKDKWYIEKNVGKVVLDGTEDYAKRNDVPNLSTTSCFRTSVNQEINSNALTGTMQLSNKFICLNNTNDVEHIRYTGTEYYRFQIFINKTRLGSDDVTGMKNWATNNNIIIYYVLATPIYTLIENEELLNQLEAVQLQTGENNVSVSGDLPIILDLSKYIQIAENHL